MKSKLSVFLLSTFMVLMVAAHSQAEVEWTLHKTFKTQKPPRDVEASVNGKWVFILTEQGEILIYSSNGALRDTIFVGDSIDSIKAGPREDILFLSSRTDSMVQLITLDFIQNIDVRVNFGNSMINFTKITIAWTSKRFRALPGS